MAKKTGKNAYAHLYKTVAWQRLREVVLSEELWCRFCLRRGLKIPADVVDHKIPHRGNLELFYDYDNLTALCFNCHNSTKQKMEKGVLIIEYDSRGFPVAPKNTKR